jgi:hypothetical protein
MAKDPEIAAIEALLSVFDGMNRQQWQRALLYCGERLAERDRTWSVGSEIAALHPATLYAPQGRIELGTPDRTEASEDADALVPLEVTGFAAVSQHWAVYVPGDDGGIEWFDSREEADNFVAHMTEGAE